MIHKAKKSLGQNFLKSEPALRKIVEAGDLKPGDTVLEIGPGKGALTRKLLASSCQLIAVEKDYELFGFLKTKFEKEILSGQLKLLNEDILDFDPLLISPLAGGEKYKIIANIPYNITGAILKKFLTSERQPERMVLMVQNEVAKRITTPGPSGERRGGKESLLSISVKAYGEPKMIMKVPARYFSPAPKVDSAVILIKNISRKNFLPSLNHHPAFGTPPPKGGEGFEQRFWEIVKTGFAHKRKKLSGNLKALKNEKFVLPEEMKDKRAEDLTLEDWLKLAEEYNPS
ncbi:ribosomal RNA small subunit methyltransferase A [Candidatus Nomurabacteria bacterium]|nr:ribosomal RNA small subunit methyltransferase A [Candidatus Nomurabacteria bacterium]